MSAVSGERVRSPCTGACQLGEGDLCIGCLRTGVEIGEWGVLSDTERREVLARVAQRRAAHEPRADD